MIKEFRRNVGDGTEDDLETLDDLDLKNTKTLLIVNDHTRSTPTAKVISKIAEKIDFRNILVLFATGIHRSPTEDEANRILSANLKWMAHDSKNSRFVKYGETSYSTPVEINHAVEKFPQVVVIGSVEPHYFAGYTGGRKSLLPGVASYKAIKNNHRMAMDENARALKLSGNPVAEDMQEFAEIVTSKIDIISVQLVHSCGRIIGCAFGDIFESFEKMIPLAEEIYTVDIPKKFSCCVAKVEPPYSRNFYQATKALESAIMFTKEGGKILLVADCSEGLGEGRFTEILIGKEFEDYEVGDHKAYRIKRIMEKYEIYVNSSLPKKLLEKMGFRVAEERKFLEKCDDVCIIHDAVNLFPKTLP